jgi:phosphatidylinositol glycan class N
MKILAPYVPLSAAFAALHAKLGLPPFALFLVALTLTDGEHIGFPSTWVEDPILTSPQ